MHEQREAPTESSFVDAIMLAYFGSAALLPPPPSTYSSSDPRRLAAAEAAATPARPPAAGEAPRRAASCGAAGIAGSAGGAAPAPCASLHEPRASIVDASYPGLARSGAAAAPTVDAVLTGGGATTGEAEPERGAAPLAQS